MNAPGFRLSQEPSTNAGVQRLRIEGDLDAHAAGGLVAELERALDAAQVDCVHIDLGQLAFIDSAGLQALTDLQVRLGAVDTRLVLGRPTDAVRRVLQIADLLEHFEIVEA